MKPAHLLLTVAIALAGCGKETNQPATVDDATAETSRLKISSEVASKIIVEGAKLERAAGIDTNRVNLTVTNQTGRPIKGLYFKGVYQTPGRAVPWSDGFFIKEPSGGLEHGETQTMDVYLDSFRSMGLDSVELHDDAKLSVTLLKVDFADEK